MVCYGCHTSDYIRILDEFTKAQPKYTQVSNLQLDCVSAAKNTIQNTVSAQALLATNRSFPIVTPQYTDEFVKQSNEITENVISAIPINNQLTVITKNASLLVMSWGVPVDSTTLLSHSDQFCPIHFS